MDGDSLPNLSIPAKSQYKEPGLGGQFRDDKLFPLPLCWPANVENWPFNRAKCYPLKLLHSHAIVVHGVLHILPVCKG